MSRPPPHPILGASLGQAQAVGGVFVLRFDLDRAAELAPDLETLLSPEERERAARLVRPEDRRRALASRALLRVQLGVLAERDPAALVIVQDPGGKPALADRAVRFSVSHSAGRLVLALTRQAGIDVGVDVEQPGIDRDVDAAARLALNMDDLAALDMLSGERRKLGFLRLWTAKEAALKALGVGLRRPMREVVIDPKGLETLSLARWRPHWATVDDARLDLTDVSQDDDVICLAVRRQASGANSFG